MDVTAPLAPSGLSFFRLIQSADSVVQGVMLALAVASVLCWTICFEKVLRYVAFFLELRRIDRAAPGEGVSSASWLMRRFHVLSKEEVRDRNEGAAAFQERIERALNMEIATHLRRLQGGLPLLATVGATAPFVGLFGTVWGIMNSFTGIAAAKDTSLAVVAPGIAEALLATAMGLAAAIPAVIFYNLANVFLSNAADRLSMAASRYAKDVAYGTKRGAPFRTSNDRTFDREMQAVTHGGIDAR